MKSENKKINPFCNAINTTEAFNITQPIINAIKKIFFPKGYDVQ